MRTIPASVALLSLAACGGAQEPPPAAPMPAPAPVVAPVGPAAAPVAMAPVALPLPAALPEMQRVACSWDLPAWKGQTLRLRLSESGDAFATVSHAKDVRFALPAGQASAAHVSLETGGIKLSARVAAADISVYVKAPEAAAKTNFYVGGATQLSWENGAPDEILSSVALPGGKAASKAEFKHPCASYSLFASDVDPTGVLGQTPKGRVQFRENKKIGFELNRDGANTRVAVPAHGGWLVSSEPTTAFVKVLGAVDLKTWYAADPLPEPAPRDTRIPGWVDVSCPDELQLIARVGADSAVVGTITKGTRFQVGPDAQGFTRVGLPTSDLMLSDKGQFGVRSSDMNQCSRLKSGGQ